MRISDFSVNRRVTVFMLTLLVIILGGISLSKLGLEMLPDMDYPVISIITSYSGASSEDVEETITKPIETAIAAVKDIKSVKSESMESVSLIMVEFNWGTNLDFAAQDLRDMIDQIADYLPRDVSRPLVMKFNLSQMPILMYGVTGGENTFELRKLLEDDIATRLKTLRGVASVMVMGGDEAEKQIIVDSQKLQYYNIDINAVVQMIGAANLNMAADHVIQQNDDYLLRTIAQYASNEEIANTPVHYTADGKTIYLKDIATIHDGFKEKRYHIRTDHAPTAMMMISKESGANSLTVAQAVQDDIRRIQEDYTDLRFNEIMDMGLPIKQVTNGAVNNLILGGVLAILIMFLFLRNWRPTLAISLAIPISVVATFIPVFLAGYSLNIMTLGGLALGIGMLVDNSIVVIENIYRHLEMGKGKFAAAKEGAGEVAMAITASTLTTIAVFLPMIFAEGITGILVRGLALTVAFSLFASLFVSLTIVPAIAASLFRRTGNQSTVSKSERMFEGVRNWYTGILKWCLQHRTATISIVVLMLVGSLSLTLFIGTEFMPEQDMGFMMLNVKMPVGTSLAETDAVVKQIEGIMADYPDIQHVMALVGPMSDAQAQADPTNPHEVNEAQVYCRLKEMKDRVLTAETLQQLIRARIPQITGTDISFMSGDQMMGGSGKKPIELNVYGKDLARLRNIAADIELRLKSMDNLADITNTMREGKPEMHIIIDRQKAFRYGLTAAQVASAIKTATAGTIAGIYRQEGEEIDILVRVDKPYRESFADIEHLPLTTPGGMTIPLNQICHLQESIGPKTISHEKQTRKVTIAASVVGTQDMGGTARRVQQQLKPLENQLEAGYFIEYGGSYQDMEEAFVSLSLALLLAIVLVYIVMASQFESFTQPFVVMFTMPLAIIGVMLILFATGTTLSVASFVGGIILAGIVVNNGIVLIDHTNQLRAGGMHKFQALVQAGLDRLRPVLITASTTILGMLPMALSRSEGSELKAPMALTVIGGLISATILTLVVIPVIYSTLSRKKKQSS
jgi:HAE1 family hydrophobic/amphiphilic exporter-1